MMELSSTCPVSCLSGKKVIVSGAGISGLAFVVSLRTLWTDDLGAFPDVTQYEREKHTLDHSRDGYSISIRSSMFSEGMQSLKHINMLDKILGMSITRAGNDKGYFGLWSVKWRRLVTLRRKAPIGLPKSGMRIARTNLRQALIEAAAEHVNITWDIACTSVSHAKDGSIEVLLSNGEKDNCDVLIVADGSNSRLRACLRPHDKLQFAGPVSISAVSHFPEKLPDPVCRDWGMIPSGQGVALFVAPMGGQCANWAISYMANEPREEARQPMTAEICAELLQEAKGRGIMFKEPFQALVEQTKASTIMLSNAMDKEPFAHTSRNGIPEGIVFIGDSNHAVSPFAANGANLALQDGYDLAACFCCHASVRDALDAYDEKSVPRALASLKTSHVSIAVIHSKGVRWIVYRVSLFLFSGVMAIFYCLTDGAEALYRYLLLCLAILGIL